MCIPIDPKGETLAFGVSEALEEKENGREGWRQYEESGEAGRMAKEHYKEITSEPLRSLMDHMDEKGVRLWAPYSIPDLKTWHRGRVCLIGDAAHALPPNGQGSAQAFEDAGLLGRLLASEDAVSKGYDQLFQHFEKVRRERVELVKRISKATGAVKGKSGPWTWWAKKWLMWAFFTWNRGIIKDTRLMAYDLDTEDLSVK